MEQVDAVTAKSKTVIVGPIHTKEIATYLLCESRV